jgi:hypothetical protein
MGAPSRELCGPSPCTAVALTLLSVLTASVAPASALELATASESGPAILPPIEAIDAHTDVTVFLRSGVPDELRRAALRRAWTVDPAIRDFRGCRRTPGISTTPTASRALAISAPRSISREW